MAGNFMKRNVTTPNTAASKYNKAKSREVMKTW
jgi:hypothetical protein